MPMKNKALAWERYKTVAGLNQFMEFKPPLDI